MSSYPFPDDVQYRLVLTKGGKAQAAIRMQHSGLRRSGLETADIFRIESLRVGETYHDADGDRWTRTQ